MCHGISFECSRLTGIQFPRVPVVLQRQCLTLKIMDISRDVYLTLSWLTEGDLRFKQGMSVSFFLFFFLSFFLSFSLSLSLVLLLRYATIWPWA